MSFLDYETEIEDQIETLLLTNNSTFEVNRYYDSSTPNELLEFVLSKVKSVPAAFLRCVGADAEQINSEGDLINLTYKVQIIIAYNDHGKSKQIKTQPRKINDLLFDVIQKFTGFSLNLTDQPPQKVVFKRVADLFTTQNVDARIIEFEVQGVVQQI